MKAQSARGFTLVELMIVVAVVAVLATLAVPNLKDLVLRSRMKTAASDLHHSLLLARSEAIKRNANVVLQPVSGSDWSQGWSVQVQSSGDVLMNQDRYSGLAFSTRNAANTVVSPLSNVLFSGNGRESGSAGSGVMFVITASEVAGISARCVVLDPSGRPAVRVDADTDSSDGCN